jgi:ribosome maturation protein Sdo1
MGLDDLLANCKAKAAAVSLGLCGEEWQKDGSWICIVRIPGGMQSELFSNVNRLTKGTGEIRLLEHST